MDNGCQAYTGKCRDLLNQNSDNEETFLFSKKSEFESAVQDFNRHFAFVDALMCKQEADKIAETFLNITDGRKDDAKLFATSEEVWKTIDLYRMAVTRLAGHTNVLLEAEILAIIGRIYQKMRLKDLAESSFKAAMDLCQTTTRSELAEPGWFVDCEEGLVATQRDTRTEEENEEEMAVVEDLVSPIVNRRCSTERFLKRMRRFSTCGDDDAELMDKIMNKRTVRIYELYETEKCFVSVMHTIIHVSDSFGDSK
jgi:hypothetical protein